MNHTHLSVSIDWLLADLWRRKTIKAKNKLASAFLQDTNNHYVDLYVELILELRKMKEKWWEAFTSEDCDNVQPDWRCWWHTKL